MLTAPEMNAMRALHACCVIRARAMHPGYLGLVQRGLATATAVDSDRRDFRLTERGAVVAQAILRRK